MNALGLSLTERPRPSTVLDDSLADLLQAAATLESVMARAQAMRAEVIDRARQLAELTAAAESAELQRDDSPSARRQLAHRVLASEVACALRVPERSAERLIDESDKLVRHLSATHRALAEGSISYRHAQVIIDEARSLPEAALPGFESAVLPVAARLTAARLRPRARIERERCHPESIEQRVKAGEAERNVSLEPAHDGMAWLSAFLPAARASAIYERLTTVALDVKRTASGSDDDSRTLSQLRADVFTDLLVDGVVDATGCGTGVRATVHVTVPVERLLGAAATNTSPAPTTSAPTTSAPTTSVPITAAFIPQAELEGYGPLDDDTARELAARAPSFTRLLRHPESGAVLSVGRDRYAVPADLTAALRIRDRTCRFPGCGRSARRSDIDHTIDWQFGGTTSIDNLAHLCPAHHQLKHRSAWQVSQQGGGVLRWRSPSGSTYVTHPEGGPAPPRARESTDTS
ncbi:HNH endonuclease signature motif containing protein [Microcella indica]|uniref:HNH endonuclease signature motif containing protein n=1 Tax=Microcella indica TaxID=2750620 RepID=UPI0015CF0F5D|nr:HNH endonuclease signature motif containing protein [Microcella indica]